jgi:hypothetical protein
MLLSGKKPAEAQGSLQAQKNRMKLWPKKKKTAVKFTVLVIFLCLGLIYGFVIRPSFQKWGATEAELSLSLPGDDLNPNPVYTSTRAITINAPAENIWPWLAEGKPGLPEWHHILATAVFISAGLGCALFILARTRKWLWLSLPLAYFLLILFSTSDLRSAIVGFVAITLVLIGFIVFRRRWWVCFVAFWVSTFSVLLFSSDAYLLFGILFWVAIIVAPAHILIRQKLPPAPVSN